MMDELEAPPSTSPKKLPLRVEQSLILLATSLLLALIADRLFLGQNLSVNVSLFAF